MLKQRKMYAAYKHSTNKGLSYTHSDDIRDLLYRKECNLKCCSILNENDRKDDIKQGSVHDCTKK